MRIYRSPDGRTELALRGSEVALLFAVVLTLLIGAMGLRRAEAEDCPDRYCVGVPGVKMRASTENTPTATIAGTPWLPSQCGVPPKPAEGLQAWGAIWRLSPDFNPTYQICTRLYVDSRLVMGEPWQLIVHRGTSEDVFNIQGMYYPGNFNSTFQYMPNYEAAPLSAEIVMRHLDTTYRVPITLPPLPPTITPLPTATLAPTPTPTPTP